MLSAQVMLPRCASNLCHFRAHRQSAVETLKSLLVYSLVKERESPWAPNILLVKKPYHSLKLYPDYRDLNQATRFDACLLLRVDDDYF